MWPDFHIVCVLLGFVGFELFPCGPLAFGLKLYLGNIPEGCHMLCG